MMKRFFKAFAVLLLVTGCSTRPKLLPNDKLLEVGVEQSEKDVNECLELADTYADDSSRWKETAANTGTAAVIGAGAGAVGGAIAGNTGRGTAVGAAGAAVAALLGELIRQGKTDPTYQNFAEFCLRKKGYEIAGWRRFS